MPVFFHAGVMISLQAQLFKVKPSEFCISYDSPDHESGHLDELELSEKHGIINITVADDKPTRGAMASASTEFSYF